MVIVVVAVVGAALASGPIHYLLISTCIGIVGKKEQDEAVVLIDETKRVVASLRRKGVLTDVVPPTTVTKVESVPDGVAARKCCQITVENMHR
jgi:hypothetical protein